MPEANQWPKQNNLTNVLQHAQKTTFPFATLPTFKDNQAWLGGWIRVLSSQAANSDLTITHGLRAIPQMAWVVSSTGQYAPAVNFKSATTSQVVIQISISVGASPNKIVLFIC